MATPKVQQANGTHVPHSPEANHSPADSDREWERDTVGGGMRSGAGHHFQYLWRADVVGDKQPMAGVGAVGSLLPQPRGCGADGSGISIPPCGSPGSPEERQATFSPGSVDSPNSSMENPLDTTGDITVEEVKDFLAYVVGGAPLGAAGSSEGAQQSPGCIWFISPRSSEEVERNMRNASEDEVRPAGILIK